jgi:trigger factor
MRATAEPIQGNLVRLSVEIDEPEVDQAVVDVVRTLSRQVRVPGFRPGKVPRRVLEARMGGATALRAEALRESLPDFYAKAVADAEVDPIAPPEIDITAGEESGPVTFDAVVQVRPTVAIPGYEGLRVTLPALAATDEEVGAQVDRLRENDGELVAVSRPAIDGDHVTIDVKGTTPTGEEAIAVDDLLYEVGSGTVVPELDEELRGTATGGILAFDAMPAGLDQKVAFRVLVKDVKQKKLPAVTDQWASEASEFDTLAELRDDLRRRMGQVKVVQAQLALRDRSLGALVDLVDDEEIPEILVDEELNQRVHDLGHRLEEQRISLAQLLAVTGRTQETLLAELRQEAFRAVKGDLALRAVADAREIVVTDQDLEAEVAAMATRMEMDPATLGAQLDRAGRTAAVRSELRKAKALTWLLDSVELVDEEGNALSRDDLRVDQRTVGEDLLGIADADAVGAADGGTGGIADGGTGGIDEGGPQGAEEVGPEPAVAGVTNEENEEAER